MLKKIDWYFIKQFLITLVFILLLFSLLTVVFDASEKIDKFLRKSVPIDKIIVGYYFNFIPYILNLISPIFIFISALYFTSRLAYRSEIVALLASGVSFWRLLRPYFIVALFITGIDFYLKGYIIPITNKDMVDFETEYLTAVVRNTDRDLHRQIEKGKYFYLESYAYSDSLGRKFAYEEFNGQLLTKKIMSRYLKWNPDKREWYAYKYFTRNITPEGEQIEKGDTLYVDIKMIPTDFAKVNRAITAMINPDLIDFIEQETQSGNPDVKMFKVELYQRFSLPFASFVLVMIAFAIASRKIRGGIGMHLMLGLLIATSYILMLKFSTTFAQYATLDPLLAVWLPNIFFVFIAGYLLYKSPK